MSQQLPRRISYQARRLLDEEFEAVMAARSEAERRAIAYNNRRLSYGLPLDRNVEIDDWDNSVRAIADEPAMEPPAAPEQTAQEGE